MDNNNFKYIYMKNLQTSLRSHNELARICEEINSFSGEHLVLDFKRVDFVSANQFAVLGCILSDFQIKNRHTQISIANMNERLTSIIRVNGFNIHISWTSLPDRYNTSIPYKIFNVSQIDEFEKYITIKLFNRSDIPKMSSGVKECMIDNVLEIFNNVKEHTNAERLYTCGQYFPKKKLLYFTVVDSGETIPYNVTHFFQDHGLILNGFSVNWAIQSGNSTRRSDSPGGLGLYLLSDFIRMNEGELFIVSGNESFEQTKRGTRCKYLEHTFSGTIVTMGFNMADKSRYCLASEKKIDLFI